MKGTKKMEDIVKIGNKEIVMRCNANTPRKYRDMFNKDLIIEMQQFLKNIDKKSGMIAGNADFGMVERLAYVMAYQHDNAIGSMDDFFEQFDGIDDIYTAFPEIIGVWEKSKQTLSDPKKNIEK